MTTKTLYQHIVQIPDVVGGKPHIAGHRITVQNIIVWHEHKGFTIFKIVRPSSVNCGKKPNGGDRLTMIFLDSDVMIDLLCLLLPPNPNRPP